MPISAMTFDEYIAFEEGSDVKHELIDGRVYAMSGALVMHHRIAFNTAVALRQRVSGGPCETFFTDMKLKVEATGAVFYPDVFVTCDPERRGGDAYISDATLIVEVLSPSTEAHDRGKKFKHYLQLPSLAEFVLIDSRRRAIDMFRRREDGWLYVIVPATGPLVLQSVDLTLSCDEIYAGVGFDDEVTGDPDARADEP